MKSYFGVFPVLLLLAIFATSAHAELKVGFINSQEIFVKYKGTEDAQKKFEDEKQRLAEEAEKLQREIEELKGNLERQSLLLSEETKAERMAEIEDKEREFQQFYFEAFGEEGRIVRLNAELTQPIIEKINEILDRIGQEEEYDIIFDVAPGGIVYAREGLDLTPVVLDELNAMVKIPPQDTTDSDSP